MPYNQFFAYKYKNNAGVAFICLFNESETTYVLIVSSIIMTEKAVLPEDHPRILSLSGAINQILLLKIVAL
ncbi:hypothetical protein B9H04_06935 [Halorubrum ezzemoulense DSM 17463]|uniref:Uncharacterized protein n=1 Tax=Halorubrum ezzemoulense DSM 17463 TaxID=1121945 RepID=A0A1X4H982_HALEZ|nr:hypothetical protein B9H04_06935 [Halorubrum ezzemoulense DSM 17463]